MAITVHKLSGGDGYSYLTRQVAVSDGKLARGNSLSEYYSEKGERPGVWMGKGAEALGVAGTVHAHQMQALLGEGLHPESEAMVTAARAAGMGKQQAVESTRLGRRYPKFQDTEFTKRYTAAFEGFRVEQGRGAAEDERKVLREDVAAGLLTEAGSPVDAYSVQEFLGAERRRERQPVAGFDLVMSPPKSVSVLWGLADPELRDAIELGHRAAVQTTVDFIEAEVAFTRMGGAGVAQVDVNGIVAMAFEHRESRSGDMDLHTHLAVANRVQTTVDDRWRSLDARVLYSAATSAGEVYNAAIEDELRALGFASDDVERGEGKRPVRELQGIPANLNDSFSQRRQAIDARLSELLRQYRADHGKDPSKPAQAELAQQANLETREAKGDHHSLTELVQGWRERAERIVGVGGIEPMIDAARGVNLTVDQRPLLQVAAEVTETLGRDRSTWNTWHMRSEVTRQLRSMVTTDRAALEAEVRALVLDPASTMRLSSDVGSVLPPELVRANGEPVFRVHGAARYTSPAVLDAEQRLLGAAQTWSVYSTSPAPELLAGLTVGQQALVKDFTESGLQLGFATGLAGTGKTTAMRAVARAWEAAGYRVIGLSSQATAAEVLGTEIGVKTQTIARLLTDHRGGRLPAGAVRAGDMLLVDEAGMAGTADLDELRGIAVERGAVLRLVGDHRQIASVSAGGALGLLANDLPHVELDEVMRFRTPGEDVAGAQLRVGDPACVAFYMEQGRLHEGTRTDAVEQAYQAWMGDRDGGRRSIIMTKSNSLTAELNNRARADLMARGVVAADGELPLRNDQAASVGDVILTRRNDSRLQAGAKGQTVKNGHLWTVQEIDADGSLKVAMVGRSVVTTLPPVYVKTWVDLGYASTVTRQQGVTVDYMRGVLEAGSTREETYMALTRAKVESHLYIPVEEHLGADMERSPDARTDGEAVFRATIARAGNELSATEVLRAEQDAPERLDALVPEYLHGVELLTPRVDHEAALRETFTDAEVAGILSDPAADALKSEMDRHGPAAGAVVAGVVAAREIGTADSTAQVVQWRLEKVRPAEVDGPLPWVPAVPDVTVGSAALKDWTAARGREIADRVTALADRVDTEQPAWAAVLQQRPVEPERAIGWDRAAGLAAAYREEYAVTGDDVLGDAPGHPGRQLDAYRAADTAVKATAPERPLKDLTDRELKTRGSSWWMQRRMLQGSADRAREYITTNTEKVAARQGPLVQAAAAQAAKDAAADTATREAEVTAARAAANKVIAGKQRDLADAKGMFAGKRRQELGRDIDALTTARDRLQPRPAALTDPEVMDRAHAADVEALAAKEASLTRDAETLEVAVRAEEMVRAEELARADEQARQTPAELAQERMEQDRAMEMVEVAVDHGIDI